jgi:hypothetical protein
MSEKICNGCGADEIATVTMSEGAWERHEERNKKLINKLIAVILVLVVLLVGSNVAWLIYESQFETVEATYQEVVQEADNGENNFVGGDIIGTTDSENSNG